MIIIHSSSVLMFIKIERIDKDVGIEINEGKTKY